MTVEGHFALGASALSSLFSMKIIIHCYLFYPLLQWHPQHQNMSCDEFIHWCIQRDSSGTQHVQFLQNKKMSEHFANPLSWLIFMQWQPVHHFASPFFMILAEGSKLQSVLQWTFYTADTEPVFWTGDVAELVEHPLWVQTDIANAYSIDRYQIHHCVISLWNMTAIQHSHLNIPSRRVCTSHY